MDNLASGGPGGTGGIGGDGGTGGDAQGGGLYVAPGFVVSFVDSSITFNEGFGGFGGAAGLGGDDGLDGQGVGGGVYLGSPGSHRKNTRITGNTASTSHNNVFGTFS
jgi:hypothetical protein